MKPKKGNRYVRIDSKTIIEVGSDVTDEEAIKEFLEKVEYDRNRNKRLKKI